MRPHEVHFIPGGMTGRLQFHDKYFNKPFKQYITTLYGEYALENKSTDVTRACLVDWVIKAQDEVSPSLLFQGIRSVVLPQKVLDHANNPQKVAARVPVDTEGDVKKLTEAMDKFLQLKDDEIDLRLHEQIDGMTIDVDEDTSKEEQWEAEKKNYAKQMADPRCQFCQDGEDLRECAEPGCKVKFHHFCAIEAYVDEDKTDRCRFHAT